jgi:hypothetical protein
MERSGRGAKALYPDGTGYSVAVDEQGEYTVWHIENGGSSYNPTPLLKFASAEEAARLIGAGPAFMVDGVLLTLASRRPLAEIIGY